MDGEDGCAVDVEVRREQILRQRLLMHVVASR